MMRSLSALPPDTAILYVINLRLKKNGWEKVRKIFLILHIKMFTNPVLVEIGDGGDIKKWD